MDEQGHRDFWSMIRVFPFHRSNVDDGAINTDHHIDVMVSVDGTIVYVTPVKWKNSDH